MSICPNCGDENSYNEELGLCFSCLIYTKTFKEISDALLKDYSKYKFYFDNK